MGASRVASYLWVALTARIFESLFLSCPTRFGYAANRFVTQRTSAKPFPLHPGLPAEVPSVAPARGRPLDDIDQSPSFGLTDPAPVRENEFD